MPDHLVDKPCPPGQHRHGGGGGTFDYCHEVGRKHRTHGGEAVHTMRGEHYSKPRAARNHMKGLSLPEVEDHMALIGPKRMAGVILQRRDDLRGKVSEEVRQLLHAAATNFMREDKRGGLDWLREAHNHLARESKMQKAKLDKQFWCQECGRKIPPGRHTCPNCGSEDIDLAPIKKAAARPDAEPVVAYEEKRIVINEVGTRLKAIANKLDRMVKHGVANDLASVEKRAEKIVKRCC